MRNRTLGKFGILISSSNKTRSSAFDWNNSRTFKIEEIMSSEKTRTFPPFLRTQNSFNFRCSGIKMKNRTLGKFGFSMFPPNKLEVMLFIEINTELLKLKEF